MLKEADHSRVVTSHRMARCNVTTRQTTLETAHRKPNAIAPFVALPPANSPHCSEGSRALAGRAATPAVALARRA
jgi:hypothetical protein